MAAIPASAAACTAEVTSFWLVYFTAQASSRRRKWSRRLAGAGTRSARPTDVSILMAPEIAPELACSRSAADPWSWWLLGEEQGWPARAPSCVADRGAEDEGELLGGLLQIGAASRLSLRVFKNF